MTLVHGNITCRFHLPNHVIGSKIVWQSTILGDFLFVFCKRRSSHLSLFGGLQLKVSKSRMQFLELSILPKNAQKAWKNYPKSPQDNFFSCFANHLFLSYDCFLLPHEDISFAKLWPHIGSNTIFGALLHSSISTR